MKTTIITIDGPAGAGKSSVSRCLAEKLNFTYVDTGALYRGVAYEIDKCGIDGMDDAAIERFLPSISLDMTRRNNQMVLFSSGRDISGQIRSERISMLASSVSAKPAVRKFLLEIQRKMGKQDNSIFEGRDMGTVVFPEADHKFYLYADLSIRAKRRHKEIDRPDVTLGDVQESMAKRDKNDSTRCEAPLKPAADAVMIDSTELNIDEVVDKMVYAIKGAL
ncbi:MAG: (d)CMP kinase [Thermodesulfobacteriota bacterium]|nr:(d)CMP kinase [Thermodesulfobacteriota bacterium]